MQLCYKNLLNTKIYIQNSSCNPTYIQRLYQPDGIHAFEQKKKTLQSSYFYHFNPTEPDRRNQFSLIYPNRSRPAHYRPQIGY